MIRHAGNRPAVHAAPNLSGSLAHETHLRRAWIPLPAGDGVGLLLGAGMVQAWCRQSAGSLQAWVADVAGRQARGGPPEPELRKRRTGRERGRRVGRPLGRWMDRKMGGRWLLASGQGGAAPSPSFHDGRHHRRSSNSSRTIDISTTVTTTTTMATSTTATSNVAHVAVPRAPVSAVLGIEAGTASGFSSASFPATTTTRPWTRAHAQLQIHHGGDL
jgi:hypothetical protein